MSPQGKFEFKVGRIQNFVSRYPACRKYSFLVLLIVVFGCSLFAQTLTILHTFTGSDGRIPSGRLFLDPMGNLYGTTSLGGTDDEGVVFKIDSSENFTVLYNFDDGGNPNGVIKDFSGNLYGTTARERGYGNVFRLDSTGNYSVLYAFRGQNDGKEPAAGLIREEHTGAAGALYGTTPIGGTGHFSGCNHEHCGVLFAVDHGAETVLHNFDGNDGEQPQADLILDGGNLYGNVYLGGNFFEPSCPSGCGSVFRFDTSHSAFSVLHKFAAKDGSLPIGRLAVDSKGNLYGVTWRGGSSDYGVIFRINPTKRTYSVLYNFSST